ncbi:MAG: bifunctional DNA-binding transcriptional regulator/O6-methylguanine-DNA methyltransferase Ada [Hyphomicrobiales bacterium]|nr:bifunctional DNA-binding transcriptional regulator/O6-methylguanine-DNA methyltransferase Ada [Hyphomicrobiales bacterium]
MGGSPIAQDPRWKAVLARREADFVFAVQTTGVYCRPSCPARRPAPQNVRFFANGEQARGAGFRACLRCAPDAAAPDERRAELAAKACAIIDAAPKPPQLAQLARLLKVSPSHLHRQFKQTIGLTPAAYAAARRAGAVRAHLRGQARVTDAFYAAGFNSSGRFYAKADAMLGMKPGSYRDGADERIEYACGRSSLGVVLAARAERGICAIFIGDDANALADDLATRFPRAQIARAGEDFHTWLDAAVKLVEDPASAFALPLDIRGTAFQHRVWTALQQIPPGQTLSYSALAAKLGAPRATRAVASAVAANPIAIAVPCHRILRADASISGYRWGPERKQELLRREKKS